MRLVWRIFLGIAVLTSMATSASAQTPLTWQTVRDRFRATNPLLQAGAIGVDESRAAEITAFLRPNPLWSLTWDQIGNTQSGTPFSASNLITSFSYLHEREHQRELRRDSAEAATAVAASTQGDLDRTLVFILRGAFVQVLQAKAFRTLAENSLSNYDQVLAVSRDRFRSGDIAQIDLDRLELQRVTYESDVQTADVNLRSAKLQLLRLLNDQTDRSVRRRRTVRVRAACAVTRRFAPNGVQRPARLAGGTTGDRQGAGGSAPGGRQRGGQSDLQR
jgi:outer membrane protein, heavy metal efflux system